MSWKNNMVQPEPRTPLRRSPRFLHRKNNPPSPQEPSSDKSKSVKISSISSETPINSARSNPLPKTRSRCFVDKNTEELCRSGGVLRRSPRLNGGTEALQCLRWSPRSFSHSSDDKRVKNCRKDQPIRTSGVKSKKDVELLEYGSNVSKRKSEASEKIAVKNERSRRKSFIGSKNKAKAGRTSCESNQGPKLCIVAGLKASGVGGRERIEKDAGKGSEDFEGNGKRKRGEERKENCESEGWSKEQEVALQRAYLVAKPTPHFWKKVAKLVPGKSAQDCFDKINSDLATPPQPPPRSRAKKITSSPLGHFSLSASTLLNPVQPKIEKTPPNRQKSHLVQKKVRQLVQKSYRVEKDHEADLFSVLEPHSSSSTQVLHQNTLVSTPNQLLRKKEFLMKCQENSSDRKKPLSRLGGVNGSVLVSPPVLKQVKNKMLHEKYIDLLHYREAKRKTKSAWDEKNAAGKENKEINREKTEIVKAAKTALISDARNAIDQLKHLHVDAMSDSNDLDCGHFDCGSDDNDDDNEGESRL